jgi:hypothetical protein
MRRVGIVKVAGLAVAAGLVLGGMGIAGALPGVANGTPPVSTPDPDVHAGEHPDLGAGNGAGATADVTPADASSRAEGLATAMDNVTNETAADVLDAVSSNTPGPGFGTAVSDAAREGVGGVSGEVPPAQADGGLSHKP